MLRTTDPTLENCMFLRDVVIPWMREHPERVNFNVLNSKCGTYGCLYGWYAIHRYGMTVREWADSTGLGGGNMPRKFGGDMSREFGGDYVWLMRNLFEMEDVGGTLDERAARLDKIIAEKLEALEVKA